MDSGADSSISVPNGVHRMRRCFEYSIESQALIDEVEEVSPVPRIVFDHSVSVQLDKQIEDEQDNACSPSQYKEQPALFWAMETRNGEETVRYEVTHQNQVYNAPEDEPRVVLQRSIFELVVFGDLGLHFPFEEFEDGGVRVFARLWVLKDVRVLRP